MKIQWEQRDSVWICVIVLACSISEEEEGGNEKYKKQWIGHDIDLSVDFNVCLPQACPFECVCVCEWPTCM